MSSATRRSWRRRRRRVPASPARSVAFRSRDLADRFQLVADSVISTMSVGSTASETFGTASVDFPAASPAGRSRPARPQSGVLWHPRRCGTEASGAQSRQGRRGHPGGRDLPLVPVDDDGAPSRPRSTQNRAGPASSADPWPPSSPRPRVVTSRRPSRARSAARPYVRGRYHPRVLSGYRNAAVFAVARGHLPLAGDWSPPSFNCRHDAQRTW